MDRNIVQTLNHIADCGVKADKVYPSYPSKTFPNHYSIVTGLWPESHGITDNSVFDPTISPVLESMKSTKYEKFFEGEPVSLNLLEIIFTCKMSLLNIVLFVNRIFFI